MTNTKTEMVDIVRNRHKGAVYRRVLAKLTGMRGAAQRVAQLLAESPTAISNMSIAEIADHCETSPATLLRISREAGYANFTELRAAILTDEEATVNPFALERMSLFLTSLMDTFDTMDLEKITEAVRKMLQAPGVVVFGAMLSASVAQMLELFLRRQGVNALYSSDSEVAVNALHIPNQLLLCVSHLGGSPPVIRVLSHARKQGNPVILLTNQANAPGSRYADLILTTNVTTVPNTGMDVFCRASGLFLVDLLLQEVARQKAAAKLKA